MRPVSRIRLPGRTDEDILTGAGILPLLATFPGGAIGGARDARTGRGHPWVGTVNERINERKDYK
jgi:hypothetical protein